MTTIDPLARTGRSTRMLQSVAAELVSWHSARQNVIVYCLPSNREYMIDKLVYILESCEELGKVNRSRYEVETKTGNRAVFLSPDLYRDRAVDRKCWLAIDHSVPEQMEVDANWYRSWEDWAMERFNQIGERS